MTMAMPRKTEVEHWLAGTKPHDRAADCSHVKAGRPKFPKDLDASLKPIFKRLVHLLQERKALTSGDVELIRLYCFVYDRHTRNVQLLREEGELCTYIRLDSNGQAHPQVKINLRQRVVNDCERQMASLLNQMALTPASRDRARPTFEEKPEREMTQEEKYLASIGEKSMSIITKNPIPFVPMPSPDSFEEEEEEKQ
jgi:P27 family predicted phage terminase small subunit